MAKWKLAFTPKDLTDHIKGDCYKYCPERTEICLYFNQKIQIILLEKDEDGFWEMPDTSFGSNDYTMITIKGFYQKKLQNTLPDDYIFDQCNEHWNLYDCIIRT